MAQIVKTSDGGKTWVTQFAENGCVRKFSLGWLWVALFVDLLT
jgi:hypothetical protein